MTIAITDRSIELAGPFLKRRIDLSDGPFSHEIFIRPPGAAQDKPLHLDTGWGVPFEAALQIGGRWHFCGIRRQKCALWQDLGNDFEVRNVEKRAGTLGDLAVLTLVSPSLGVEVAIEYELSDAVPVLRKSVRVRNVGSGPVTVENIAVELIYNSRLGRMLHILHDYRREVAGDERFFAGYCDFRFPENIDVELAPGEALDSFNLYELFLPEAQPAQSVWQGRVLKQLAPWALESRETTFQASGVEAGESFLSLLDQCAEAGFEKVMFFWDQLFTNTGDYRPRPELFPDGVDGVKALIGEIRKRGMKPGVYASYSIALPDSRVRLEHLDWECCDADGHSFDPGAFGNMCFLSGWGGYIRRVFGELCDWGFEEIQIDGPTDIPCHRDGHGHATQGLYHYRNWLWERALFAELRRRGVPFTIPRGLNYLLMGASAIPGGYREEDFCHSEGAELLANYRASIHAARAHVPPWATWGFLAVGRYHGHDIGLDETRTAVFEQGLASLFGCGQCRYVSGDRAAAGPATLAILRRWTGLFKQYRHLFNGDCIGLGFPDGVNPDGLLFTDPESREALAVLINPGDAPAQRHLLLPLGFAGLAGAVSDGTECGETDPAGNLFRTVELAAGEVRLVHFRAAGGKPR